MRNTLYLYKMITLAHGGGGKESRELLHLIDGFLRGEWKNCMDDAASFQFDGQTLLFSTDSYIVEPIFFLGGDIGSLSVTGTINDLAVMGASPLGISLSFIVEEGFDEKELIAIVNSAKRISIETEVPIVTGDTKVMPKGKLDRIIINTAGIGKTRKVLDEQVMPDDKIIISGGIGEHATALLSSRFDFQTDLKSDCKPLIDEMKAIRDDIKVARDITRGGIAAVLNELSDSHRVGMEIYDVPMKEPVRACAKMLGIDPYSLACEGRLVCFAAPEKALEVESRLKDFNPDARIIGDVRGSDVVLKTRFGKRLLPMPAGRIVPRIC